MPWQLQSAAEGIATLSLLSSKAKEARILCQWIIGEVEMTTARAAETQTV